MLTDTLNTAIESLVFDDVSNSWTVTTGDGETVTARYVVCALGLLSKINLPDIKGRDSFRGTLVHTGAWPEDLKLEGKRVGVIGTGSTGTQFICAASKLAKHLTVFQRSAQLLRPQRQRPGGQRLHGKNQTQLRPDLGASPQLIRRIRLPGERRPRDERFRGGA